MLRCTGVSRSAPRSPEGRCESLTRQFQASLFLQCEFLVDMNTNVIRASLTCIVLQAYGCDIDPGVHVLQP